LRAWQAGQKHSNGEQALRDRGRKQSNPAKNLTALHKKVALKKVALKVALKRRDGFPTSAGMRKW
jgi:hypothetical protein